jgi:hypothetical protein
MCARRRYARAGSAVEARFVAAVEEAVERIRTFPFVGGELSRSCRQIRVRRLSYTLVYRILNPTRIEVVAVAHTSRRPNYWGRRVP